MHSLAEASGMIGPIERAELTKQSWLSPALSAIRAPTVTWPPAS
jgi:hypothetical protein